MSAKRENEGRSTGSEPPNPGRSGAITKQSSASVPITLRNDSEEPGNPCGRRSAGFSRSPARRTANSASPISTLTISGFLIAPVCFEGVRSLDTNLRSRTCGVIVLGATGGLEIRAPVEHTLKQSDDDFTVLQDQPILIRVPAEHLEAELLVEPPRRLEILDGQADGEGAKLHDDSH